MIKRLLSVVTAAAVFGTTVLPFYPEEAEALPKMRYSVFQKGGDVVVAVYNPYAKELKVIHYWLGIGVPRVYQFSNTDCKTFPIWTYDVSVDKTRKIKCPIDRRYKIEDLDWYKYIVKEDGKKVNMDGEDFYVIIPPFLKSPDVDRYRACLIREGDGTSPPYYSYYWLDNPGDDSQGYIAGIGPVFGAVCREIVDPKYINQRFGTHYDRGDYGKSGPIENVTFKNISLSDAMDLVASYMKVNAIPIGLFGIETLDVTRETHKSLFKKKVVYKWWEKTNWKVIAKVDGGVPFKYGYNLLNGDAIGNTLPHKTTKIYEESHSGWTMLGVIGFQLIMLGIGWATGLFSVASPYFGMTDKMFAGTLGGFFAFNDVWNVATQAGDTYKLFQSANPVPFTDFTKDTSVTTGKGYDQLASRLRTGSDLHPNLNGYTEAKDRLNARAKFWNLGKFHPPSDYPKIQFDLPKGKVIVLPANQ